MEFVDSPEQLRGGRGANLEPHSHGNVIHVMFIKFYWDHQLLVSWVYHGKNQGDVDDLLFLNLAFVQQDNTNLVTWWLKKMINWKISKWNYLRGKQK